MKDSTFEFQGLVCMFSRQRRAALPDVASFRFTGIKSLKSVPTSSPPQTPNLSLYGLMTQLTSPNSNSTSVVRRNRADLQSTSTDQVSDFLDFVRELHLILSPSLPGMMTLTPGEESLMTTTRYVAVLPSPLQLRTAKNVVGC